MKRTLLGIAIASCLAFAALAPAALRGAEDRKPSILFCSPQGAAGGWIDLRYATELAAKGFHVDYTEETSPATDAEHEEVGCLLPLLRVDRSSGRVGPTHGSPPVGNRSKEIRADCFSDS